MKKQWKGFLLGVLSTIMAVGLIATAAGENTVEYRQLPVEYHNIKVTLDGKQLELKDANGTIIEPFTSNGTTYLPVRAIASALGLQVGWDEATSTVILTTGSTQSGGKDDKDFVAEEVLKQLEVTPYTWKSSYYYCLGLEVKNNSNFTVDLSAQVTFLNEKGEMIGATSDSDPAIPAGQTVLLTFTNEEAFSSYAYNFHVSKCSSYLPATQDVSITYNIAKNKVVVSATNNGKNDVSFLEVKVLFFKNGEPVYEDFTYIDSNGSLWDSKLETGMTRTGEISCYYEFDSVQLYLSGRASR